MALVAFIRGVNVGGHRTFRPARLAADLSHLDAVNIGATGILVVRSPVGIRRIREEIAGRLPFEAAIVICQSREISGLLARDFFSGYPVRPDVVRFVGVLARQPRSTPALPLVLPPRGPWLLKVLARDGRFLVGVYRRRMQVIGCLGQMDRLFGVPVTTRGWSTMAAIGEVLGRGDS